jgi:hypothetical protein
MPRAKKQVFAELTPKTERAHTRMSYHTNRWILKEETDNPYCGAKKGTWLLLQSRNGQAMLWVMKTDDQDFGVRVIR